MRCSRSKARTISSSSSAASRRWENSSTPRTAKICSPATSARPTSSASRRRRTTANIPARPIRSSIGRTRKGAGAGDRASPRPKPQRAVANEDFEAAMRAMAKLRPHVDAFFDKVTVNVDDKPLRENRLKLLNEIRAATRAVADFSKIEGLKGPAEDRYATRFEGRLSQFLLTFIINSVTRDTNHPRRWRSPATTDRQGGCGFAPRRSAALATTAVERREAPRARSRRFAQADRSVARAAPEARAGGNIRPRGAAHDPGASRRSISPSLGEAFLEPCGKARTPTRREMRAACFIVLQRCSLRSRFALRRRADIARVRGPLRSGFRWRRLSHRTGRRFVRCSMVEFRSVLRACRTSFHTQRKAHGHLRPHIAPLVALIAGILILLVPRLLNYIVAIYLISSDWWGSMTSIISSGSIERACRQSPLQRRASLAVTIRPVARSNEIPWSNRAQKSPVSL